MKTYVIQLLTIILTSSLLLVACIGERLILKSNDYYKNDGNKLCIDHPKSVINGYIKFYDDHLVIPLERIKTNTSCAIFNINENITIKSIDNESITIKPYKLYSFKTNLFTSNGFDDKSSDNGPYLCFIKDNRNNYILKFQNAFNKPANLYNLKCE